MPCGLQRCVPISQFVSLVLRNLTLAVEPSAENKVASDDVLATLPVLIREVCPCGGVALCRHP